MDESGNLGSSRETTDFATLEAMLYSTNAEVVSLACGICDNEGRWSDEDVLQLVRSAYTTAKFFGLGDARGELFNLMFKWSSEGKIPPMHQIHDKPGV